MAWTRRSALLGLVAVGCASTPAPSGRPRIASDSEIADTLAQRIDDQKRSVGIVIGIIGPLGTGPRIVAHGAMDQVSARPVGGDTVYDIASVTKTFTALVFADMVERGEVKQDDPVAMYLPAELKMPVDASGRTITLVDLATYTSTLPWDPSNMTPQDPRMPYADYTMAQLAEFLASYKPPYPIGTRYAYSNVGFNLLGLALSRRAGLDYDTLVRRRVTGPLGMKDTRVLTGQTAPPDMEGRLVTGYNTKLMLSPHHDHPEFARGSGALSSTANDLLTYLDAMIGRNPTRLAPAIARMRSIRFPSDTKGTDVVMGFGADTTRGRDIFWKSGGHEGFSTWIGFDLAQKTGAVVLSNSGDSISDIGLWLFDAGFVLKA